MMREFFTKLLFLIIFPIISWAEVDNTPHWNDLPSEPLTEILYEYDKRLDVLVYLISQYHSIKKDQWETVIDRINLLEKISSYACNISRELNNGYVQEATKKISKIAHSKKLYLEELQKLKKFRLNDIENEVYRPSSFPKNYLPLFLYNERKFKYETQEIWGQFFLEAVDPCHRRSMTPYYDKWLKDEPNHSLSDFFLWLENRNIPIFTPCVQVLKLKDLEKYKINIVDGKFYDFNGNLITTIKNFCSKTQKSKYSSKEHIFIIDQHKNIFMGYSDTDFSHITLSRYKPLIGSGVLILAKGKVKEISFNSGHYCPKMHHNIQTLDILSAIGVSIKDKTKVIFYDGFKKVSTTVKEFRKLMV